MYNLYIPLCSLVLGVILLFLYLFKVNNVRSDNKIYFIMVIDNLVMTIFCMIAIYLIYKHKNQGIIMLANKIECCAIVNYFINILYYICYLCEMKTKNFLMNYTFINTLALCTVLLLPVTLEVTNDLSLAKVFFTSTLTQSKNTIEKDLNDSTAGYLRTKIANRIDIRHTPKLRFVYDKSIAYGNKIEDLIEKIHKED